MLRVDSFANQPRWVGGLEGVQDIEHAGSGLHRSPSPWRTCSPGSRCSFAVGDERAPTCQLEILLAYRTSSAVSLEREEGRYSKTVSISQSMKRSFHSLTGTCM